MKTVFANAVAKSLGAIIHECSPLLLGRTRIRLRPDISREPVLVLMDVRQTIQIVPIVTGAGAKGKLWAKFQNGSKLSKKRGDLQPHNIEEKF